MQTKIINMLVSYRLKFNYYCLLLAIDIFKWLLTKLIYTTVLINYYKRGIKNVKR